MMACPVAGGSSGCLDATTGYKDFGLPDSLLVLLAFGLVVPAFFKVETYPLTAWQMYSYRIDGPVIYYKVIAWHESGERRLFHPEYYAWVFADTRYRDFLERCFVRPVDSAAVSFLAAAARHENETRPSADPIVSVVVEQWRWDYRRDRENPSFGEKIDSCKIDVGTANTRKVKE
jgi:hypothetical protein